MTNRQIRLEGDLAFIPLTQGYEAVIDAADVPLVSGVTWRALVRRDTVYAQAQGPRPARTPMLLHRVLTGEPVGFKVDHRDGDGLNNRRTNLRVATSHQNGQNSRLSRANTSGLKGASWEKRARKWQASIRIQGTQKHLGYYATAEEAHAAYCAASQEHHGEFGRVK